jgi:hypothetical protein
MDQHKPPRIILLIVILVLFLSACSGSRTRSGSHSNSDAGFTHETTTDTIDIEIKPAMRSHTLDFSLEVDTGQISTKLTDPNGDVQWSEVFEAPAEFDETFALDLIVGHWSLEITLEEASGSYSVRWEGSN